MKINSFLRKVATSQETDAYVKHRSESPGKDEAWWRELELYLPWHLREYSGRETAVYTVSTGAVIVTLRLLGETKEQLIAAFRRVAGAGG